MSKYLKGRAAGAMEFKLTPTFKQDVEDRTVTGLCAVMGNVDLGKDRIAPGAFTKTILENRKNFRHLWQHDADSPPIATILDIKEIGKSALPSDLTAEYPDASGALQVTRKYLDTPRADEVLSGIKDSAINGMSFAYDPVRTQRTKAADGTMIRDLLELKFYESSDVNWGMNPAARAQKSYLLYSLLNALDTGEDLTTLLTMGNQMAAADLATCQQAIALLLSMMQQAVQADAQEDDLFFMARKPQVAAKFATATNAVAALLTAQQDKAGRISTANTDKLKNAIEALQGLLNAAEPPASTGMALTDRSSELKTRLSLAKATLEIYGG